MAGTGISPSSSMKQSAVRITGMIAIANRTMKKSNKPRRGFRFTRSNRNVKCETIAHGRTKNDQRSNSVYVGGQKVSAQQDSVINHVLQYFPFDPCAPIVSLACAGLSTPGEPKTTSP